MRRRTRDDGESADAEGGRRPWQGWTPHEQDDPDASERSSRTGRSADVGVAGPTQDISAERHGDLEVRVYGEPSTFGAVAWHDPRGWWKLAENGEANDVRSHFGRQGDVAVAAVSLRGNRHRLRGQANQDSFAIGVASSEKGGMFVIIAVCDGIGSGRYSAFGARLAASHFVHRMRQLIAEFGSGFHEELIRLQRSVLRSTRDVILKYRESEFEAPAIDSLDLELDDVQCTLSFAVIPTSSVADSIASRRVVLGYVGDSPIHVLSHDGWQRVHDHRQGEIWDTATEGLLSAQRMSIGIRELHRAEALLISTDGFGNYLEVNGSPTVLGEDLATRWRRPVDWLNFTLDTSFQIQGADDDRTAVMVWPGIG